MFKLLTHWVFPGCCCLCDGLGHDGLDLCKVCFDSLLKNDKSCSRCAIPIEYSDSNTGLLCGVCLKEKLRITRTTAPFIFAYPADYIVRSLKFNCEEKYSRLMGELLARSIQKHDVSMPEYLVPVPLHQQRYLERGFNQAELLAHYCAIRLGLPVENSLLTRTQHTPPQTGFGRELRRKNLRGAFEVTKNGTLPRYVALIDDVITTGSTVREISQVLLKAGVERVDVWAFCRARKRG